MSYIPVQACYVCVFVVIGSLLFCLVCFVCWCCCFQRAITHYWQLTPPTRLAQNLWNTIYRKKKEKKTQAAVKSNRGGKKDHFFPNKFDGFYIFVAGVWIREMHVRRNQTVYTCKPSVIRPVLRLKDFRLNKRVVSLYSWEIKHTRKPFCELLVLITR